MQNTGTAKFSVEKLIHKVVTPTVFIVTHTNKEMGTGGVVLIKKIWQIFSPNSTLPSPFKKNDNNSTYVPESTCNIYYHIFSHITTIRLGGI